MSDPIYDMNSQLGRNLSDWFAGDWLQESAMLPFGVATFSVDRFTEMYHRSTMIDGELPDDAVPEDLVLESMVAVVMMAAPVSEDMTEEQAREMALPFIMPAETAIRMAQTILASTAARGLAGGGR